jgi:hypothetical protein
MSDTSALPPGRLDVISAARYGTEGYPHEAWTRLRRDPSLVNLAADEIVRWTTPVNHFVRTANQDYELRGEKIR